LEEIQTLFSELLKAVRNLIQKHKFKNSYWTIEDALKLQQYLITLAFFFVSVQRPQVIRSFSSKVKYKIN